MLNLPIAKGKQARAQRIVIYGPEGIGKSTLASAAPSPLFLDTEMGTGQLDVDRLDIENLGQIGATLNELLNQQHEYQTVVLDTADNLWRLCADSICAENNWTDIEKPGFGKGYAMAADKFRIVLGWFDRLIASGVNVVVVSHAKVDKVNPPDNAEYSKYCIKVSAPAKQAEASREFLKEWCDCMLFCNFDMTVDSSKSKAVGKSKRVVNTVPAPAWEAKNRYSLPETMEMTAESMRAIFKAAQGEVQRPAQHPAPAQEEEVPAQELAIPMASDEDVLTDYFVGTGTLRPEQTLADLPANIAADLKAHPEHTLYRALMWCEKYGNKDTSEVLARLETRSWKGEQAPATAQTSDEEVLTSFFVGTGKLQPGQTLADLPANIAAALQARPEQALAKAKAWYAQNGKEQA